MLTVTHDSDLITYKQMCLPPEPQSIMMSFILSLYVLQVVLIVCEHFKYSDTYSERLKWLINITSHCLISQKA